MTSLESSSSVVSATALEDELSSAIGVAALGFAEDEVVPVFGSQSQQDVAAGLVVAPSPLVEGSGTLGRLAPLGSTMLDSPSESILSDEVARTLVDGTSEADNSGAEALLGEHSCAVVGVGPGVVSPVVVDSHSPTLLLSSPERTPPETALLVADASLVSGPISATSSSWTEHALVDREENRGGGYETFLSSVAAGPDRVVFFRGNCRVRPYRWPARAETRGAEEPFAVAVGAAAPLPVSAPPSAEGGPRPDPFSVLW